MIDFQGVPQNVDLVSLFPPDEGEINQYYGRIGSGKTRAGTARILAALSRGQVVYANWKLNYQGYDERDSRFKLFLGVLGLKRTFVKYPKENLRYLPVDDTFHDTLSRLTDCEVHLDEGHLAFDSYKMAAMNIKDRANVLHTRHFNRKIVIYSQRPTAIHVTLRANVNRFFKCENVFYILGISLFRITEYQDLVTGETVDEEQPVSVRYEFGSKKIFEMYDTKYLRGDTPVSQLNYVQVFKLSWRARFLRLFSYYRNRERERFLHRYDASIKLIGTPPLPPIK